MSDTPRVSVVTGVHNGAAYLDEAIRSVLAQEGIAFEFIVVDDGSTDATPRILATYAASDCRLRILTQPRKGLTAALIAGCNAARGEYIARQDADDRSAPRRLAQLAALLDARPSASMVSSGGVAIGPRGEELYTASVPKDEREATELLLSGEQGPFCHGAVMFRADRYKAAGGYRPEFWYAQDVDLWLRLCERGVHACTPEPLYGYRWRPDSISSVARSIQQEFGRLAHECRAARVRGTPEAPVLARATALAAMARQQRVSGGTVPIAARARANGSYFVGTALVRRGDWRGIRYLWNAVQADPAWARAQARLLGSPMELLLRGALAFGGASSAEELRREGSGEEVSSAARPRSMAGRGQPREFLAFLTGANVPANPDSGAAGTVYQTNAALRSLGHSVDEIWAPDIGRLIRHGNLHQAFELPWRYRAEIRRRTERHEFDAIVLSQPHAYLAAKEHRLTGRAGVFLNRSHGLELRRNLVMAKWRPGGESGIQHLRKRFLSAPLKTILDRHWLWVSQYADGVVFGSEQGRAFLLEHFPIQEWRVRTIPHGVSPEFIEAPVPGFSSARLKRLIHVAQFADFKAPDVVARVVNTVLQRHRDVSFTWVTERSSHAAVARMLDPSVLSRVTFCDWVRQKELVGVLDAHGVMIFPSYFEGFGKAGLEAMCRGLCVVASDDGGMRDYIQHGVSGYLSEVGHVQDIVRRVEEILADEGAAGAMSVRARERALHYTWKNTAELTAQFARELLERKSHRPERATNFDDRRVRGRAGPAGATRGATRTLAFLTGANVPANVNAGAAGTVYEVNQALRGLGHTVDEIWAPDLRRRIDHGNLHQAFELPWRYRTAMRRRLTSTGYDVIVLSQPHAYLAARDHRERGLPGVFVNRSHGLELRRNELMARWDSAEGASFRNRVLRPALRAYLDRHWAWMARYADGIIFGCSNDRDFLLDRFPIAPWRVRTIAEGVSETFCGPVAPDMTPRRLQRLLHVAQFADFKAPSLVARVASEILARHRTATFTWVTDHHHHDDIRRMLDPLILERVRLRDAVVQGGLVPIFDDHGILIFPSYFEGFGKVGLEAMARGLCVTASDEGGMHDVVRDRHNGMLSRVGDVAPMIAGIEELLADCGRAREMAAQARETALRFTWRASAEATVEFCNELLQRKTLNPGRSANY